MWFLVRVETHKALIWVAMQNRYDIIQLLDLYLARLSLRTDTCMLRSVSRLARNFWVFHKTGISTSKYHAHVSIMSTSMHKSCMKALVWHI